MHDRDDFLDKIRANPKCDTARLVYADWLDENGECDRDIATAEFIRASCDMRDYSTPRGLRMPDGAYAWIGENWKRLMPDTLALAVPTPCPGQLLTEKPPLLMPYQSGRTIKVDIGLEWGGRSRHYAMRFEFSRGFLVKWWRWSAVGVWRLRRTLDREQPFYEDRGHAAFSEAMFRLADDLS